MECLLARYMHGYSIITVLSKSSLTIVLLLSYVIREKGLLSLLVYDVMYVYIVQIN